MFPLGKHMNLIHTSVEVWHLNWLSFYHLLHLQTIFNFLDGRWQNNRGCNHKCLWTLQLCLNMWVFHWMNSWVLWTKFHNSSIICCQTLDEINGQLFKCMHIHVAYLTCKSTIAWLHNMYVAWMLFFGSPLHIISNI